MLTGDKQETAINIGYSCNMLTEDFKDVFVISGTNVAEVNHALFTVLFVTKVLLT